MRRVACIGLAALLWSFAGNLSGSADAQSPHRSEIDNGLLRISFDKDSRTWDLDEYESAEWRPLISGAAMSLTFRNGDSLLLTSQEGEIDARKGPCRDRLGNGTMLHIESAGKDAAWELTFALYENEKMASVSGGVKNVSNQIWKPASLHLVDLKGAGCIAFDSTDILMQVNGYQSWDACEVIRVDSSTASTSYWSTVFYEPAASSSLLLGFLGNGSATNSFRTTGFDGQSARLRLNTSSDLRALTVPTGKWFHTDTLLISQDPSPAMNLRAYAKNLQKFAPEMVKPFTPAGSVPAGLSGEVPSGWCSWYYYYQNIAEDSILRNLNAAARHLKDAGLRYIQIDDGYQIAAGDWETNRKFPHGHKWLVDRIHEKGLLAGLWVAPFAVAESSALYRTHSDWVIRDEEGQPKEFFSNAWWGGRIFSLDPTRTEVQRWLERLFSRITGEWGYDYVKIDFLHFAADGTSYSLPVTSAQAYRMGLRAIRRGVGSDRFVLGCGAPLGSSIGFVDGMRIGTDISAEWSGIVPGADAASQRFFYHDAVWYNDPDCLVVRDPLTLDQARLWAAVIALSGQMDMISDDLAALPEERLSLLRSTLPPYGIAATPVNLLSPPKQVGLTITNEEGSASALPDVWKFQPGDSMLWKDPSYDDAAWKDIHVPDRWEKEGYPDLDGFAWYRCRFTLPQEWRDGALHLYLGKVDDCDETYLNGMLIGRSGSLPPAYATDWTSFRIYDLPQSVLRRNGENVLAVRVYDGGGAGGIYNTRQYNIPSLLNLRVEKPFEQWNVVGAFNWNTKPAEITISASALGLPPKGKYLLYERWTDSVLGELDSSLTITLPPTSSRVLAIHSKPNRPMILSTSRHITEGAVDLVDVTWDDANAQLKITSDHLDKDPYAVVIYVPPGFEYRSVSARAKSGVEHVTPSALKITFPNTYGKKMIWRILFHRSA